MNDYILLLPAVKAFDVKSLSLNSTILSLVMRK